MKKSFLRNWVCAIHFFSLCYIFSLTSHWSFDPIFVLHPPRIVMLHHLILFLRCFLIFRTFTDFSYTYKNRADQWFLLSQCRVNEIFFFVVEKLGLCYTFSWVSVCVCKGWFGNCKICKSCYVMVSQRKEFWFNCYCFFFFFWMNWC